jgi:hypothetical protein
MNPATDYIHQPEPDAAYYDASSKALEELAAELERVSPRE